MPNTLFIRPTNVHQLDDAQFEWAVYDVAGEQLKYGSGLSLDMIDQTLMQNGFDNTELVALWPASAAFSSHVSLPGNQTRYLQQALPFAVEEQVAQDIEQIHIALGQKNKQGSYSVINIDQSMFAELFALCTEEQSGLSLKSMHVDAECLPLGEEQISICLTKGSVLLREQNGHVISFQSGNLIPYLDSVFLGQPDEHEAEDMSVRVWVDATYMDEAKLLIAQIEQYPHLDLSIEQFGMTEFELLCENYFRAKQAPTNLCQGDFQISRKSSGAWQRWRSVALVASIGFLLQLGVFIAQGMHYNKQADQVGEEALAQYKKVVPNSTRVTVAKLPRIIKGKLNQSASATTSDVDFLALLGEAGYQFDRSKFKQQLQFKSINYSVQRGELTLEMQAQSFDQLESLKNAIVSAGLTAKISSAVQEKEYFRGRISVSGA